MKRYLLALILTAVCLPAMAHNTKPSDIVTVEASTYNQAGDTELTHKVYSKPWGQMKIDAATVKWVDAQIVTIKSHLDLDKTFRITHLVIVDNEIQRVMLTTEYGTSIAIDRSVNQFCYITPAGNGPLQASIQCVGQGY